MLELILTIGNYMNSSAKSYEPVHGFDISFLPKVNLFIKEFYLILILFI